MDGGIRNQDIKSPSKENRLIGVEFLIIQLCLRFLKNENVIWSNQTGEISATSAPPDDRGLHLRKDKTHHGFWYGISDLGL